MAGKERGGSTIEQLRQRNRELSILNSIAAALNREVDLSRALHTTLEQVAGLLSLETGWVWLLQERDDESYLAAAQNLPPGLINNPDLMEGTCYCLDTYRGDDMEGAANVNVVTCSRLQLLVDGTDGLRYHASIPLYGRTREKLGVLNVATSDWRELSPDDLLLLGTIGDLLSIAIERARLFEQSAQVGALNERNRLAREIHDTIAQGLAAITLQLETAEALMEAGPGTDAVRKSLNQALKLARTNLEEARRSVSDLRAAPLEGRSLSEALALLAGELTAREKLEISFETAGDDRPLPHRLEAGLLRIAQEALTNVVRHSGADRVFTRLEVSPQQVQLSIEDNGEGFEPSEVPEERYGLVGINERTRLLGGIMKLQSSAGLGTRIEVTIPLLQLKNGDAS